MVFFCAYTENLRSDPFLADAFEPPVERPTSASGIEQYRKFKLKAKRNFERYGFTLLYDRIIKAGYFTQHNEPPIHSAKRADAIEVLRYIAIENSNS